MKTDPSMIDINDENRRDDRPVEVPVFSIESSDKPTDGKTPTTLSSDRALRLFENAKTNLMNNRVILMKDLI